MTKELFMNWLCHFVASIPGGLSSENMNLLIFDGHGSQIALETVEEKNTMDNYLLTFPTHTTHWLRPLDVSVFAPFKSFFMFERDTWMKNNHGVEVKRFELFEITSNSLRMDLTPQISRQGLGLLESSH